MDAYRAGLPSATGNGRQPVGEFRRLHCASPEFAANGARCPCRPSLVGRAQPVRPAWARVCLIGRGPGPVEADVAFLAAGGDTTAPPVSPVGVPETTEALAPAASGLGYPVRRPPATPAAVLPAEPRRVPVPMAAPTRAPSGCSEYDSSRAGRRDDTDGREAHKSTDGRGCCCCWCCFRWCCWCCCG